METRFIENIIIGGGLTGLVTAHFLKQRGASFMLLEQAQRLGGVIRTVRKGDFLYECGPNSGTVGNPRTQALLDTIHPECARIEAAPVSRNRLIYKHNAWHPLPSDPLRFMLSPLFTLRDKVAILGEPRKPRGLDPNESLANFVTRRLGSSFLEFAVDPFVLGIFAGDPSRLVTRYALPKLYKLEQTYGSLIGGTIKLRREQKKLGERPVSRSIFSFKQGLEEFVAYFQGKIGHTNCRTGLTGLVILPIESGFSLTFYSSSGQQSLLCRRLICTVPGPKLPGVLTFTDEKQLEPILAVHHAPVIGVSVGYRRWSGMPLNGFGGLIPFSQRAPLLGALFMSSCFPDRAPVGGALLSLFLGGIRNRSILGRSDREIETIVCNALRDYFGARSEPDLLELHRYESAIAQYGPESERKEATLRALQQRYPGLFLAGNYTGGVGIADRIAAAGSVVDQIFR